MDRRQSIQVRLRSRAQEAKRFHRIVIFILLIVVHRTLQIKDAVRSKSRLRNPWRKRTVTLWNNRFQRNTWHREEDNLGQGLSEVIVETAVGDVAAIITTRSVHNMGFQVGDRVAAWSRQPMSPCVAKINGIASLPDGWPLLRLPCRPDQFAISSQVIPSESRDTSQISFLRCIPTIQL